jgi:hypothetical protein
MKVDIEGDNLRMKYEIERGISEIQGAIFILQNMGFPKEMMDDIHGRRKGKAIVPTPLVTLEEEEGEEEEKNQRKEEERKVSEEIEEVILEK